VVECSEPVTEALAVGHVGGQRLILRNPSVFVFGLTNDIAIAVATVIGASDAWVNNV
jgi:hypothetical protein